MFSILWHIKFDEICSSVFLVMISERFFIHVIGH